jgi:hypothetical protein
LVDPLPADVKVATKPKLPPHMVHVFATQAAGSPASLRAHRGAIAPSMDRDARKARSSA